MKKTSENSKAVNVAVKRQIGENIRVRMAPSPTGEYHIGHIRTILYNYAFSKKNNGKFIIRIEDTDQERYVEGSVDRILDVIKDYGLDWDEGPGRGGKYGPYVQSERLDIYKKYAQKLIDTKNAYRCFCTKEELTQMREQQHKEGYAKTMYDGRCRFLDDAKIAELLQANVPHVIRQKIPKNKVVEFEDQIYGKLSFDTNEIDDTVLLKSDGYPTYHLGVVVDDHLMNITHVMRGNDWLPSTPKHVLLHQAFGWELPTYIHLPNLKEKGENRKLSKRFGAVFARDFLEEGYLTEAVLNFLMFLGWNPGTEKEIYSMDEFIQDFSINRIHKTDLVAFDREKLLWMNGYYIREMSIETLWERLVAWSEKYSVDLHTHNHDFSYNIRVVKLVQERLKTFSEFVRLTHYFYTDPNIDKKSLFKYVNNDARGYEILKQFRELFENVEVESWQTEYLENKCHDLLSKNGYKPKEAFMTLRIAVTGEDATPPIFDVLQLLTKQIVLKRLSGLTS